MGEPGAMDPNLSGLDRDFNKQNVEIHTPCMVGICIRKELGNQGHVHTHICMALMRGPESPREKKMRTSIGPKSQRFAIVQRRCFATL